MIRKFSILNFQFSIKLILLLFTFYILHSTFYISPAFAQTSPQQSTSGEPKLSGESFRLPSAQRAGPPEVSQAAVPVQSTVYSLPSTVSPTSPLYTDLLVHNLFHSFSCLAVGQSVIGQPCLSYQMTKDAQGALQGVPYLSSVNTSGGVLGTTTSLIGMLYTNPPVRTVDYLASISGNFGIVKEANAQVTGSGEAVLHPLLSLWQISRNISYVLIIIIFLIIGLMIMLRSKLNPQTVITAQAAIPGLVVGLIMITFSYFLAGLISDTAFIGTNIVGYYFSAVKGQANNPQNLAQEINSENVLSIFSSFIGTMNPSTFGGGVDAVMGAIDKAGGLAATIVHGAITFLAYQYGSQVGPILAVPVGTPACALLAAPTFMTAFAPCMVLTQLIGQVGGGAAAFSYALANPNGAVSLVVTFILIFILLYSMFRLAFRLINNYLTIIFLVISAPFQLLAAALPGRQGIATGWILNILANVLAFPAVLAVFYFVAFLLGQDFGPLTVQAAGTINVVDKPAFPLFGGLNLDFVRFLLAFGALMATPAIPDIINKSIGRLGQAGQLIGQEIGGAYGGGQRYAGQAGQAPAAIGKDLSGLQQLQSQKIIELDQLGNPVGSRITPGIWTRITTKP